MASGNKDDGGGDGKSDDGVMQCNDSAIDDRTRRSMIRHVADSIPNR